MTTVAPAGGLVTEETPSVSASRLAAWAMCPRLAFYERRWQPKGRSVPQIIGARVDQALKAAYGDRPVLQRMTAPACEGLPIAWARAAEYAAHLVTAELAERGYYDTRVEAHRPRLESETLAEVRQLARGLVLAVAARYRTETFQPADPQRVDVRLDGRLARVVGRPDLVRIHEGAMHFCEVKSGSALGPAFFTQYRHRIQTCLYAWLGASDRIWLLGLARGSRSAGRWQSPLVYAYTRETTPEVWVQGIQPATSRHWRRVRLDQIRWRDHRDESHPVQVTWRYLQQRPTVAASCVDLQPCLAVNPEAWIPLAARYLADNPGTDDEQDYPQTGLADGRCLHERGRCPYLACCFGTPAERAAVIEAQLMPARFDDE